MLLDATFSELGTRRTPLYSLLSLSRSHEYAVMELVIELRHIASYFMRSGFPVDHPAAGMTAMADPFWMRPGACLAMPVNILFSWLSSWVATPVQFLVTLCRVAFPVVPHPSPYIFMKPHDLAVHCSAKDVVQLIALPSVMHIACHAGTHHQRLTVSRISAAMYELNMRRSQFAIRSPRIC